MAKLVLDDVGAESQNLVEHRSRHGAKAVTTHVLRGDAHAAHGRQDCVLAHRATCTSRARKHVAPTAGQGFQILEDGDSLGRNGYEEFDGRLIGFQLAEREAPFRLVQIDVTPLGTAKFPWSHEYQGREAESRSYHRAALVSVQHAQEGCCRFRLGYGGEVPLWHGGRQSLRAGVGSLLIRREGSA